MTNCSQMPLFNRRRARLGAYVAAGSILCLSAVALRSGREQDHAPRAIADAAPTPSDPGSAPDAEPMAPRALDPAAELEIERLSRLSRAELVAAAQRTSGFSRLLAMNVLWARGEHAAVEQVAAASGDRTLVAKARALANRAAGH